MGRYTKKDAIRIVSACAKQYKEQLVNKSLLFICVDKHHRTSAVTFTFDISNFLHLTGLRLVNPKKYGVQKGTSGDQGISASDFYHKCLDHKLKEEDFYFVKDGTTELKLDVLQSLLTKNLSANMVGDFHSDKPMLKTDKLAGSVTACMGFVMDQYSGRFVPNTVIKADIRKHSFKPPQVVACYRKNKGDVRYGEITYLSKKIALSSVQYPQEYTYLMELSLAAAT